MYFLADCTHWQSTAQDTVASVSSASFRWKNWAIKLAAGSGTGNGDGAQFTLTLFLIYFFKMLLESLVKQQVVYHNLLFSFCGEYGFLHTWKKEVLLPTSNQGGWFPAGALPISSCSKMHFV